MTALWWTKVLLYVVAVVEIAVVIVTELVESCGLHRGYANAGQVAVCKDGDCRSVLARYGGGLVDGVTAIECRQLAEGVFLITKERTRNHD